MTSRRSILGLLACGVALIGCDKPEAKAPATNPVPAKDSPESEKNTAGGVDANQAEKSKNMDSNTHSETAIVAGGCFWGMEEIIRQIPGVLDTEVGYAGGTSASPTYNDVRTGATGHAESIKVVFDPEKLSFETFLSQWFFKMHDPTTKDRQGNDRGSQYRSAIFYTSEEQKTVALAVIDKVNKSGFWDSKVVTEVSPAGEFTPAEGYHQDYLQKNPGGYTCHYMRSEPVY